MSKSTFEGWAIVELMGHRKLAGNVTEATIAGAAFLRLDVPSEPPVTQYYAPAAVYAITPTTEELATRIAKQQLARLPGQSTTVNVAPDDLAALVDRYTDGLVDEVKIAIAGQCSCHEAGCLHDLIRAAARDPEAIIEGLKHTIATQAADIDRLRDDIEDLKANSVELKDAWGRLDHRTTSGRPFWTERDVPLGEAIDAVIAHYETTVTRAS